MLESQESALIKKLPKELHLEIFDRLGPAGQRLLGATCKSLYDPYKKHYYEETIVVKISEAAVKTHSGEVLVGSTLYRQILRNWLAPPRFVGARAAVEGEGVGEMGVVGRLLGQREEDLRTWYLATARRMARGGRRMAALSDETRFDHGGKAVWEL